MLWPVSLCSYVNDTPPYLPFLCPSLARQLAHVLNAFNNFTDTHTQTHTHTAIQTHSWQAQQWTRNLARLALALPLNCATHMSLSTAAALFLSFLLSPLPSLHSVYQTSPPCSSSNKLRFKCKRSRNKMKQHLCLCSFFICHLSSTLAVPWQPLGGVD